MKKELRQLEMEMANKTVLAVSHKDTFDRFWAAYPKKRAKVNAWKAWQKLKLTRGLYTEIMQGLNLWKTSIDWQRQGGQFVPLPATFINEERWTDDVAVGFIPVIIQPGQMVTCHACGSNKDVRQINNVPWCRDCYTKQ